MSSRHSGRKHPIGRGEKVRDAVLAAALGELSESGYAALTIDNVAQRAGVHKTTVYRRWADRNALIVDALGEQIAQDIPIPDTGSFEADLRALARAFVRWATSDAGKAILAAMLSDAVRIPEIAEARRKIFAGRVRRAEGVINRAVERREIPPDSDPREVIKSLVAPLYLRLLITGDRLDQAAADRAATVTMAATAAGALSR